MMPSDSPAEIVLLFDDHTIFRVRCLIDLRVMWCNWFPTNGNWFETVTVDKSYCA